MINFKIEFKETEEKFSINLNENCERLNVDFSSFQSAEKKDIYKGDYEVTPTITSQILETKNKLLKENVKVKEIPFFEVSNEKGGNTIYIGRSIE